MRGSTSQRRPDSAPRGAERAGGPPGGVGRCVPPPLQSPPEAPLPRGLWGRDSDPGRAQPQQVPPWGSGNWEGQRSEVCFLVLSCQVLAGAYTDQGPAETQGAAGATPAHWLSCCPCAGLLRPALELLLEAAHLGGYCRGKTGGTGRSPLRAEAEVHSAALPLEPYPCSLPEPCGQPAVSSSLLKRPSPRPDVRALTLPQPALEAPPALNARSPYIHSPH